MNAFDWALVLILLVSTVAAFAKGFIRVLFSLVGLIAGIVLASWNYEQLAIRLAVYLPSLGLATQVLSFLLILAAVVIAFGIVASVLRRTVSAVGLGFLDRLLGAVFGAVRGCLIVVVAMMGIAAFAPRSSLVEDSQLAPYFLAGAHAVSFVVPEQFQLQIANGATRMLHPGADSGEPRAAKRKDE